MKTIRDIPIQYVTKPSLGSKLAKGIATTFVAGCLLGTALCFAATTQTAKPILPTDLMVLMVGNTAIETLPAKECFEAVNPESVFMIMIGQQAFCRRAMHTNTQGVTK